MKTKLILFSFSLLLSVAVLGQNQKPKQMLDSGTIDNQFEYLIKYSNRYQEYKVVKRTWLDELKASVNDSLNELKQDVESSKNEISQKDGQIESLTRSLDESKETVAQLNAEKDGISLFGTIISKPLYNTILWSIIGVLLAALVIYIIRFQRSNSITQATNSKFDELEQEYESFRQRSLEREQQIRRKLQDELNKQKKDK